MENRKYKVNRDDIYVGEVIRICEINRYEETSDKPWQLEVQWWHPYRSMLFVPTEEKLSNDLLYRSPNYPILNLTENIDTGSIVIKGACSLAPLLKYFGYNEECSFEDVMRIRNTFFTGRFAKDNCGLFGYKETMADDVTFYANGQAVTDPRELERRKRQFRAEQRAGHRMFSGIPDGVLPSEYFDVLDERGDKTFMEAIQGYGKMNAFAPHKQEGPVKKLTRF